MLEGAAITRGAAASTGMTDIEATRGTGLIATRDTGEVITGVTRDIGKRAEGGRAAAVETTVAGASGRVTGNMGAKPTFVDRI